jgi:hypothetical protein
MKGLIYFFVALISCTTLKDGSNNRPLIILEKTACYGSCPVFKLTVFNNGKLLFNGIENTKLKGNYCGLLKKRELNKLREAFQKKDFFAYKDSYLTQFKDLPTTYITYFREGKSKKIKDYDGAPIDLRDLENMVQNLIDIEKWTACQE